MSDHRIDEHDLLALIEGMLPEERREKVRAALVGNPDLVRRVEALVRDRKRLQAMAGADALPGGARPPADLARDALAAAERDALLEVEGDVGSRGQRRVGRLIPAAAAAAVLLAAAGGWLIYIAQQTPDGPARPDLKSFAAGELPEDVERAPSGTPRVLGRAEAREQPDPAAAYGDIDLEELVPGREPVDGETRRILDEVTAAAERDAASRETPWWETQPADPDLADTDFLARLFPGVVLDLEPTRPAPESAPTLAGRDVDGTAVRLTTDEALALVRAGRLAIEIPGRSAAADAVARLAADANADGQRGVWALVERGGPNPLDADFATPDRSGGSPRPSRPAAAPRRLAAELDLDGGDGDGPALVSLLETLGAAAGGEATLVVRPAPDATPPSPRYDADAIFWWLDDPSSWTGRAPVTAELPIVAAPPQRDGGE